MSRLIELVHSRCRQGKHLWWAPWQRTKRCVLCGALSRIQIGSRTITMENELIKWSETGTPAANDQLGFDTTEHRPSIYLGGEVQHLATSIANIGSGTLAQLNTALSDAPCYGNLRAENQNSGISCTSQSTYYLYDQFEASDLSVGLTTSHTNDRITITQPGDYLVLAGGGAGGTADESFEWELHKNGFRTFAGCRVSFKSEIRMSFACNIMQTCSTNDYLDLRVRCYTAAGATAYAYDATMSVIRIG